MIPDIIFQISVFGDFTAITPNDTTINAMIANFKDYGLLPAIFQENNFNLFLPEPQLTKMETTNRLSMVSVEKKLNVMFASGRIDINKSSADLTAPLTSEDLTILLDILGKATSGQPFTRVALNTTAILNNPKYNVVQKLQPCINFYANPSELTLRLNKQIDLSIGANVTECSNVIIILQKTVGQLLLNNQPIKIDNGIIVQFDINTQAENPTPRFSVEQAKRFITSAEEIRQTIICELIS